MAWDIDSQMKIKTQFYIMIIGFILLPLFIFVIMFSVNYFNRPERYFVPGYTEIFDDINEDITENDWNFLSKIILGKPVFIDYIILNSMNVIIYTTSSDFTVNTILSNEDMIGLICSQEKKFMYQFDNPVNESDITVISRISRIRHKPSHHTRKNLTYIALLFIMLTIFCSIICSVIIRSITKSVMTLEKYTKDLANGDLSQEINVKGQNEITSLTKNLNIMRLKLQDNHNRRNNFIMGVSHDLRTPIALIKGYSEAIMDGMIDSPEKMKNSLEIIIKKSQQLEIMIDDLINFVKLDNGEWKENLKYINLSKFLNDYGKRIFFDGNLLKKDVIVNINIPEEVSIPMDEKLIVRALENITSNSFRYSKDFTKIFFSAEKKDNEVLIIISDEGYGIHETDLPYVFEPYFRGTNSRREEGSGLGLAVVKSVIQSHGWNISVSSKKDVGSTFTISIPL